MIKYIMDSSGDLNELEGVNYQSVPLTIYTDERTFVDDEKLDVREMTDYLREYKGRSYTACPSCDAWLKAFEGADEIYVLVITGALSGAYNSANAAKDMYINEHPDAKILIIDTFSTGPEMRLALEKIMELKNAGVEYENMEAEIKRYLDSTRLYFSLMSLHNLAQNGRVNKAIAQAVGMLRISIIGTASDKGTLETMSKLRGENKVIKKLVNEIEGAGYCGGKVRINHVFNERLARKVSEAILDKYPDADIDVYQARGLCSYYAEEGGIIVAAEC